MIRRRFSVSLRRLRCLGFRFIIRVRFKYLYVHCLCFYLTLFGFILGCAKYMQVNEIIMNFNFKTYLAIKMTQCFASIRMSNISYALNRRLA
jgi:hypothetical protein